MQEIIHNPHISSRNKAVAVQASCQVVLKKAFADPRAFFLKTALDVIHPTVDLVMQDDKATRCLVNLTAYDQYTYIHSTNVGIFSIALAKLFFGPNSRHNMNRVASGFFLHDLGKCRIPIEILNKPGKLDDEERRKSKMGSDLHNPLK